MKFTFQRVIVDKVTIEAASEEEAFAQIQSGQVDWPDDAWTCEIDLLGAEDE